MNHTISTVYRGGLRTEATHLKSGVKIITDAPPDNNGKGESFSPSDLVCAALSNCMVTIMGMIAERENIDLEGLTSEIVKVMVPNPRRISEIHITFRHPGLNITEVQRQKLINAARTCPVALSIHESIKQEVIFNF